MRALLLAAGLGTRLRPLTNSMPKCLVPINGQPLLDIWLERLTKAGFGPFLVNTHYLSKQVESFLEASPYRNQVSLVHESQLRGTAGTLIENLNFFEGMDGMLIHADNYCLADLKDFLLAHRNRPSECLMTMMTFRTTEPSSCGIVKLNEFGVVVEFFEKNKEPPGNLANGAVYILSSELLKILDDNSNNFKDFSVEVLPKLIGKIFTYETQEIFLDIGKPESYMAANKINFEFKN